MKGGKNPYFFFFEVLELIPCYGAEWSLEKFFFFSHIFSGGGDFLNSIFFEGFGFFDWDFLENRLLGKIRGQIFLAQIL